MHSGFDIDAGKTGVCIPIEGIETLDEGVSEVEKLDNWAKEESNGGECRSRWEDNKKGV